MSKTYMANKDTIERKWFVVDADGEILGRLATEVAGILRGKHKPGFTPHVDCGDYVIIVNAEKVALTGKKLKDKIYYRHSGYSSGLKKRNAAEMLARQPEKVLEMAIRGMLPKNKLGAAMYRKLYVYVGPDHPHQAQKPEELKVRR